MNDIARDCSFDMEFIINKMTEYLSELFKASDNIYNIEEIQKNIDKIEVQKSFLLDKYMSGIINDIDYVKKNRELDAKIDIFEQKKEKIQRSEETKADMEMKLQRIKAELQNNIIEEEKVRFIMDRVKQIIVHNDHLEIELEFIGNIIVSVESDKSLKVVNVRPHRHLRGGGAAYL